MLAQRLRKTQHIGVYIGNVSLTLLTLTSRDDAVVVAGVYDINGGNADELTQRLRSLVAQQRWRGVSCDVVLSSDFYRLQQTDLPKVPEHERNEALAWALRDMMDFPVNEAVLQSFTLPASVQRGGERLYAVFSHKPRLQQLITPFVNSGLNVVSIDIQELALANLLRQIDPMPATSAVLFENNRGAVLYLYVNDDLVLARQLVGVSAPSQWTEDDGRDRDTFLLEVQRTLDFFESQIARRPVQKLFLPTLGVTQAETAAFLQQNLNVTIVPLTWPTQDETSPLFGGHHYLALAAALRTDDDHATH